MDLSGYVTVNQRLLAALDKYPELRIVEEPHTVETIEDQTFLVCSVWVYTTPDDPRPVRGSVTEPIPGRSPFTKNSELMVGMTSAVGRALGYLGFGIDRAISTSDEVQARQPDALDPNEGPPVAVKRTKPSRTPAEAVQDAFPGAEVQDTGKGRRKAPTEKMTNYLKALAAKADVPVTQEQLNDFDLCRARIEELKAL